MTLPLGVCFGKMSSLHDGLAEFSLRLGDELAQRADELRRRWNITLSFRLPQALHGRYSAQVRCITAQPLHRHLCLLPQRFALWHTLHQHNPFRPPAFTRHTLATVHDLNYLYADDSKMQRKGRRRMARVLRRNRQLAAISHHVKADIEHVLHPGCAVHVVHNGVRDLTGAAMRRPPGLQVERFHFHLSRMAPLKNVDALLGMMALLPQQHLVLAGPASGDSRHVEAEILRRGLHNVSLLPDIDDDEKAWLYAHCEAFFFPSLSEGFGLPPLEAMYFGKPVFLSDRTSLPEVGGSAAAYWPDFTPAAMAAVLQAELPRLQAPAQVQAVRAHAAQFRWDAAAERYIQLYLRILGLPG
jgi:glycosyltransferase involved in cell wall biosynthesis